MLAQSPSAQTSGWLVDRIVGWTFTRPFLSRSSGSDATSGLGRTPVETMIVSAGINSPTLPSRLAAPPGVVVVVVVGSGRFTRPGSIEFTRVSAAPAARCVNPHSA